MVEEFRVGDVVQLRSGGPAMTVMGNDDDDPPRLVCSYFVDGELTTMGFEPGVLTQAQPYEPTLPDGMIDAVAH